MSKARPSAEIVARILQKKGLSTGVRRGKVLALWPSIAGPALSELTEAERLEDGVLFVRAADSVIAHQLTYLRHEFIQRYHDKLPGLVQEVRFLVGVEKKARPRSKPAALPTLSPEEEARLHRLAQHSPQDLQGVILRAGKAVMQRQKESPYPPCPICGSPSQENPCKPCQKLLGEASVQREAGRLTRFPLQTRLEGNALSAARYLAQSRLQAQLHELLPQVIQQPELIAILQDTARRYLQLRTGQKETRPYRNLLPEALKSLLKEV
jgi:predicted nucleic acid-binding Zn ribbon protein